MSNISIRSHATPCLSSAILYKVIYLSADRCLTLYSELACNVLDSHSARPAAGNAFAALGPVSIELQSAGLAVIQTMLYGTFLKSLAALMPEAAFYVTPAT